MSLPGFRRRSGIRRRCRRGLPSREAACRAGCSTLSAINHFGALAFGLAMVALFLVYPRRLIPVHALWLLPWSTAIWVMDTADQLPARSKRIICPQ